MKRLILPLIIIGALLFFNSFYSNAKIYTEYNDIEYIMNYVFNTDLSNDTKRRNLMVRNLSRNFNVKANLRGLAKRG